MPRNSQKFKEVLRRFNLDTQIVEFPITTRTAAEAATAIGCSVDQIAKSIVFKAGSKAVLVIASGKNRINEEKIGQLIGSKIEKADAEFVRQKTGYVIGGVPPFGHLQKLVTFIDEDLLKFEEVWAAAGYPNAVFKLSPQQLLKVVKARVILVK
jgi:prolyl-tRNA editing enzyme YbaK/EbsC (Cys-tRNA(Pro) deacylase)